MRKAHARIKYALTMLLQHTIYAHFKPNRQYFSFAIFNQKDNFK